MKRAIGGVGGALPALAKQRSRSSRSSGLAKRGGKAGGLAMLTAAAGIAFKNRSKITSMIGRGRSKPGGTEASRAPADGQSLPPAAPLTHDPVDGVRSNPNEPPKA